MQQRSKCQITRLPPESNPGSHNCRRPLNSELGQNYGRLLDMEAKEVYFRTAW